MRKIYLFMVGCALALTSCQFFATPKAYESEIKDYHDGSSQILE